MSRTQNIPTEPDDIAEQYGDHLAELAERDDEIGALARAVQSVAGEGDADE